jgi:RNA polymerase sigma factor (sigma-70 family)
MTPQPAGRPREEHAADADGVLAALYRDHYLSLVRLSALLVRDVAGAEKVVQDSFVAMHARWRRLGDSDRALSYLRESVVNRSRLAPRPVVAQERSAPGPPPPGPTGERHRAIALLERSTVVAALRGLPRRQREALVLRYYGNLSETQVAAAMRISEAAVHGHTARAMTALHSVLQD